MRNLRLAFLLSLALFSGFGSKAQSVDLLEGFKNPPADCRPKVWWHWVDGNVSMDGIRKDLLWMKDAGIGGVQMFDVGLGVPQMTSQRIAFGTPEWKEAVRYSVELADSLGLDFGTASSSGWSDTGGPWVSNEDAMKTLNWKELTVEGGQKLELQLPEPNRICGKYLTHSFFPVHRPEFDFYKDIAVIAVKIPDYDRSEMELGVTLSTSDRSDAQGLLDGDLNKVCLVSPDVNGHSWIQFSFPQSITARSFFIATKDDFRTRPSRHWEMSDDGVSFRKIETDLPRVFIPFVTVDIPSTTARFFRFVSDEPGESLDYTELRLYTTSRVNLDTEKAGFFTCPGIRNGFHTPAFSDATAESDVLDLTDCFKDGVLRWNAPEGRWRIYRFGYTIRGRMNNPATPEAKGLEIDKLDPDVTEKYYRTYLNIFKDACGEQMGKTFTGLVTDSFEAGCQTWTSNMQEEFKRRRGYDLTKWLPALAGHIIGSSEKTDRFLQDWRRTLGEMLADNHYNALDPILKEYGLERYSEFHEAGRHFPVDGMEVKRNADVPMSAFWVCPDSLTTVAHLSDIRESASVAHIYGQNIVAAESFSTNGSATDSEGRKLFWDVFPSQMKGGADMALASGLNQFVIHCSIHQPADDKCPGISLAEYGLWLNRHETWSAEARTWIDYLARCSYMLRQGTFVASIAYFVSEDENITDRFHDVPAPVPEGYGYDFVNEAVLSSDAFNYKALMIDPEAEQISIEVLRSIERLSDEGVLVAGDEPSGCLGRTGSIDEFSELVNSIWHSGRSNVIPFNGLPEELLKVGCKTDVDFTGENLSFVHRRLGDGRELYYLANFEIEFKEVDVSFNVFGRKPYILHADTGAIEDASYKMENGQTVLHLTFGPRDSQFILFDEETDAHELKLPVRSKTDEIPVLSSWKVSFNGRAESPEDIVMNDLESLSDNEDNEVRYFSGTATYSTTFRVEKFRRGESSFELNLGKVYSMARVRVNGKDCGLCWKVPFTVDVTNALKPGKNTLEVEVINGWANHLIGDARGETSNQVWAAPSIVKASDPLHPSGLLGPVRIEIYK